MFLLLLVGVLKVCPLNKVSEVEVIVVLTVFIRILTSSSTFSLKQRSFHDNVMWIRIPSIPSRPIACIAD
jgi:hypothetical protein